MDNSITHLKGLYTEALDLLDQNKAEDAYKEFEAAVTIAIEDLGENYYIEKLSRMIYAPAKNLQQIRNNTLAAKYYHLLVRLDEELDNPFYLAKSLINYGRTLAYANQAQDALTNYQRALELLEQTGPAITILQVCGLILDLHVHEPKLRDLEDARSVFIIGDEVAQDMNHVTWDEAKIHKNIVQLFIDEDPDFAKTHAVIAAKAFLQLGKDQIYRRNYIPASNAFKQAYRSAKISGKADIIAQTLKTHMESIRNPNVLSELLIEFNELWKQYDPQAISRKEIIELCEIVARIEYKQFNNLNRASELLQIAQEYYKTQQNPEKQVWVLWTLADIMRIAGDLEESLKYLKEAENLLDLLDNPSVQARVTLKIGHVFRNFGDYTAARVRYNKALRLNPDHQNMRSECLSGLAKCAYTQDGNYEEALELSTEANRLARHRVGRKMSLSPIVEFLLLSNTFKEAKNALSHLEDLRQSRQDDAVNFRIKALHATRLGRYDRALNFLNESLDLGKQLENQRGFGKKWRLYPQTTMISCLLASGEVQNAKTFAEESLQLSLEPPIDYNGAVFIHRHLAHIALLEKEYPQGLDHLQQALAIETERDIVYRTPAIMEMLASLYYHNGQPESAHNSLKSALEAYSERPNPYFKIRYAKLLDRMGNYALAGELFTEVAEASQYHPVKEYYQILSLLLKTRTNLDDDVYAILEDALTICNKLDRSGQEFEIINTFAVWKTLLQARLDGLKALESTTNFQELKHALDVSLEKMQALFEEIKGLLSVNERIRMKQTLEIARGITEALAQNHLPTAKEVDPQQLIHNKLAFLRVFDYNETARLLKATPDDEFLDEGTIRFFTNVMLLSPPSLRYPLVPIHHEVHIDKNYD